MLSCSSNENTETPRHAQASLLEKLQCVNMFIHVMVVNCTVSIYKQRMQIEIESRAPGPGTRTA